MADNVSITAGSGTTIAADDVGGVLYQRVKVAHGADGSATDVSTASPLPVSDAGSTLSVDDGGGSLTVDGTVSISGTITVDGSGVTHPISAVSLPLPTGAATAANQTTTNAGIGAPADVEATGNGSLIAVLKRIRTLLNGGLPAGLGQTTKSGSLPVTLASDDDVGAALGAPADSEATGNGSLIAIAKRLRTLLNGGLPAALGQTTKANSLAVALASDQDALPVTDNGGSLTVDGTVAISGTVAVTDNNSTLSIDDGAGSITVDNGGTFAVQAAQSGTWTVQPGNTANTTPWLVSLQPTTNGGTSTYRNLDIDETGVNIKSSAGQIYGWYLYNAAASARYVKFYNKASAPTVGTDTPLITIPLPAGAAANVAFPNGVDGFTLGIGIGATTGVADNNTGAPSANDVIVNIFYK